MLGIDATAPVSLKIWTPPTDSRKMTAGDMREILSEVPFHFTVTIDDMDWICYEVDWESGRIDFWRDYKGD